MPPVIPSPIIVPQGRREPPNPLTQLLLSLGGFAAQRGLDELLPNRALDLQEEQLGLQEEELAEARRERKADERARIAEAEAARRAAKVRAAGVQQIVGTLEQIDPEVAAALQTDIALSANGEPSTAVRNRVTEVLAPTLQAQLEDLNTQAAIGLLQSGASLDQALAASEDVLGVVVGMQALGLGDLVNAFQQDKRTRARSFLTSAQTFLNQNPELVKEGATVGDVQAVLRRGLGGVSEEIRTKFVPFATDIEIGRTAARMSLVREALSGNPAMQALGGLVGDALEAQDDRAALRLYNRFRDAAAEIVGDPALVSGLLPPAGAANQIPPGFGRLIRRKDTEFEGGFQFLDQSAMDAIAAVGSNDGDINATVREINKQLSQYRQQDQENPEVAARVQSLQRALQVLRDINSGDLTITGN